MIGLYIDKGADGRAVRELRRALKREVGDREIRLLKSGDIKKEVLDSCSVLAMPGGRDIFYHQALSKGGAQELRSWIEEGGGYLGICAGAYFGCSAIEFEKGGELEVCGERDLKFFPGIAKGPALGAGRFEYEGYGGSEIAWIKFKEESIPTYYNGGCAFIGGPYPGCEVTARYEKTGEAAAVQCEVGRGRAALIGVHPEFEPREALAKHVGPQALNALRKGHNQTMDFLRDSLAWLGVAR